MADAARYLGRALALARALPMSDRTDTIVASIALVVEEIIRTSPDDNADRLELIAKMMRR